MTAQRKKLTLVDGGGQPPDGGAPDANAWKSCLIRGKGDRIEGSLFNLMAILENDPNFTALFWLNQSSNQVLLSRDAPWKGGTRDEFTDTDACELAAWLQDGGRYQMAVSDEVVLKAVIAVARRHGRHPIRDYLNGLKWDGTPRVERMLVDVFGAEGTAYNLGASVCFMVSAVSRILWVDPKQPYMGSKVDFMLVVEGAQGKRKSTALQTLFGGNWYIETHESPSSKDFYVVIQGVWCVEIAEMDSFSKADVTSVKAAITRRKDTFRAPYERTSRNYRRECVLSGTTNENEYLRDATGGRRFLPVRVQDSATINIERLGAERDQLWAEAVQLFRDGFKWWELPGEAEDQQESRYLGDSWEDRVARWLAGKDTSDNAYPTRITVGVGIDYVTTDELLEYAVKLDRARHDRQAQMRTANAMKRLGWRQQRVLTEFGHRERQWVPTKLPAPAWRSSDPPF